MVDRMSQRLQLSVYSFSVFHVFFEQYLTIARDSIRILGAPRRPARHMRAHCVPPLIPNGLLA